MITIAQFGIGEEEEGLEILKLDLHRFSITM